MSPILRQIIVFHSFMGLMCGLTFFVLIFFSFDSTLKILLQICFGVASGYHFLVASYMATRVRLANGEVEE